MSDMMSFPASWKEFLQEYSFLDIREVYTNGSRLIPVFRVEQMMEHYLVEKQVAEYWYQGYYKLLEELANYKWISVKDRLPKSMIYDCPCFLVTDGSLIHMAYFVENEWMFADSGQAKDKMFYEVTHWMPLPQKPESTHWTTPPESKESEVDAE